MSTERFAFGANWEKYVSTSLDQRRVETATHALADLLQMESLDGETFLDIGSGSGLHSLAAFRLGATHITSIDFDADAVKATSTLRESAGAPTHWDVEQGSILDPLLVDSHHASIVYAWGVLHHTGDMWQAIRNAAHTVEPGGLLCIAIYNRVDRWLLGGSSETWRKIKHFYVRSPGWVRSLLVLGYKTHFILYKLLREGKNPFAEIRSYGERGMSWHTDVVDWVGGYPFEFASAQEVVTFCEQELGLKTVRAIPHQGHRCNEFIFCRGKGS